MGWIISVGTAGSGNKPHDAQVLGISVDMQGVAARIQVFGDDRQAAGAIPAGRRSGSCAACCPRSPIPNKQGRQTESTP